MVTPNVNQLRIIIRNILNTNKNWGVRLMTDDINILKHRQQLPLEIKIGLSKQRIIQWYEHFKGQVYVSFSGGKDSTVLLHLARSIYPDIPAVFCDTGLEYPDIKEFVRSTKNVITIKPDMPFNEVIEKYGWPVISKEQSQFIHQYRVAKSEKTKKTRWFGNKWGRGKISEKWKYILNAPFKISDKCCDVMKKRPFHRFEKESGLHPILGIMAAESSKRVQDYNKTGCNAFDAKRPVSKPLGFWLDKDIYAYLRKYEVPYAKLYDRGYERTGCMFCLYGHHLSLEKGCNRLELLERDYPKVFKYCMEKLGMKEVLKWYPKKQK